MKYLYLNVWADYRSTGIFDDIDGRPIRKGELDINEELWNRVQKWVKKYQNIIPITMSKQARKTNINKIQSLDEEGILLCLDIKEALGNTVKIRYYSEGLMRRKHSFQGKVIFPL